MDASRAFAFCLLSLALFTASDTFAQTRVEGRVVDAQSRPVSHATVIALGLTNTAVSTTTDDSGGFGFDGLAAGRFDFTASAPGLVGEARGVSIGDTPGQPIEITMRVSAVLETLIVSAAQIDQPLSRTADSVTVITGHELEGRQVTSLGEALSIVPGFAVARTGGPGTLTTLFPRGGESDYTLVLVDGVRANAFGGGIDLSQVPLAHVERIEVVRGPQSALYGADAIGGVVHVITRQGGVPFGNARIELGSRNTRRLLAATTGESDTWRWQAGGDYFEDEGFSGLAPANGERVSNDETRERHGWIGAGWRAARGTDLQGTFRYVDTKRGAPGAYGSDPARTFSGVDVVSRGLTERSSVGLRLVHPWTGPASRVRQRVELDVADYDLLFFSAFGPSESDTRRIHARVQSDAVLDAGFGVSAGIEWLAERARSTFISADTEPLPVRRRNVGTYAEGRWNAHERVSIQAGVRAEYITRHELPADPLAFPPRPTLPSDTVVSINPKASASWLISPTLPAEGARAWTRLRLAAGTGIRPPDAFEIAFTDNPDLKPERSRSVEIGLSQALRAGTVQLEATTFFNEYDDLIVSVGTLRDVSRYRTDNVSNAQSRGLELAAAWRVPNGIGLRASYTFLDTEIREIDGTAQAPSPYRVGDALLRRPRHQGSLNFDWALPRVTLFAKLGARGATLDAEPAFGPSNGLFTNAGHLVSDFGGSVHVTRVVEVFARVLNLFDRHYEEVLGYPAPGRTAFAGVRLASRR